MQTDTQIDLCRAIDELNIFFAQFNLTVREVHHKNIGGECYFRGTVEPLGAMSPACLTIERAFDKADKNELQGMRMSFAGLKFIVR